MIRTAFAPAAILLASATTALAHPGHGAPSGHDHVAWIIAAFAATAVLAGVAATVRRNTAARAKKSDAHKH